MLCVIYMNKKVVLSGETQKLNMYQAINDGLNIALENDPRSGENFVTLVFLQPEYAPIHILDKYIRIFSLSKHIFNSTICFLNFSILAKNEEHQLSS